MRSRSEGRRERKKEGVRLGERVALCKRLVRRAWVLGVEELGDLIRPFRLRPAG